MISAKMDGRSRRQERWEGVGIRWALCVQSATCSRCLATGKKEVLSFPAFPASGLQVGDYHVAAIASTQRGYTGLGV